MSATVDEAERVIGEADDPVAGLGLGNADRLADQGLADEDESAAPLDLAVGADPPDRVLGIIGGLFDPGGIAPRALW